MTQIYENLLLETKSVSSYIYNYILLLYQLSHHKDNNEEKGEDTIESSSYRVE